MGKIFKRSRTSETQRYKTRGKKLYGGRTHKRQIKKRFSKRVKSNYLSKKQKRRKLRKRRKSRKTKKMYGGTEVAMSVLDEQEVRWKADQEELPPGWSMIARLKPDGANYDVKYMTPSGEEIYKDPRTLGKTVLQQYAAPSQQSNPSAVRTAHPQSRQRREQQGMSEEEEIKMAAATDAAVKKQEQQEQQGQQRAEEGSKGKTGFLGWGWKSVGL